jgi:hypothetical protein
MASGFKKATVKSSRVPSTQSNFPVYVDLKRLNGGTSMTTAEANSIRVYSSEAKTTEWAREIVSVNEMHVKVPSMTSTTDIYVDWDGSRADYGVTGTYGRNAVWSGYSARYHLESSSISSTGSNSGTSETDITYSSSYGKLGAGIRGNGSSSVIRGNLISSATTNISFGAWIYMPSTSQRGIFFNNGELVSPAGTDGYAMGVGNTNADTDGNNFFCLLNGVAWLNFGGSMAVGWHNVVVTRDSTTWRGYIDGVVSGSTYTNNPLTPQVDFSIAAGNNSPTGGVGRYSSLDIDEVFFTTSVFSADWITTEYNNQNDEADFWGTWTDAGGSPAVAKGGILLAW